MTATITAPNPFAGLRAETHVEIERMLALLRLESDSYDEVVEWIDLWRAARGETGMTGWRWWIGEVDGETFALDYPTRDAAIADAPRAIRSGDFVSADGSYQIVEARCWNDCLDEGCDDFSFADTRNAETLSIAAGEEV